MRLSVKNVQKNWKRRNRMDKTTMLFEKVCQFMNEHDVSCVEDVFQRDSVNESCVDLVGELVEIVLEE